MKEQQETQLRSGGDGPIPSERLHLDKVDLPPAAKGPAAIDLDSADYANPKGPATTRASKRSDGVAAVPSAGGQNRAGKDSANCDDALGQPGKHRGSQQETKVVSGRGPAAAKKQVGRHGWN